MTWIVAWMFIKRWWPYLLGAAVVLAVVGYIATITVQRNLARHRLVAQELQREQEINARTMASYARFQADVERARQASVAREGARREEAAQATTITQEITNAPASENGPIAPVLQRTLERLRDAGGPDLHANPEAGPRPSTVPGRAADPGPGHR